MGRLALMLVLAPALAQASVADVFDLGPAMGKAGAVAATSDEGAAVYYNPAGLAFRERSSMRVGGQVVHSELHVRKAKVAIERPFGLLFDAATPVPLRGVLAGKLAVGIALHVLPDTLLLINSPRASEPFFPYYENRTQRVLILPGLAWRPHRAVAVGVGMNYFAGVAGVVHAADGPYRDVQAYVEEELYGLARLHAGARVQVAPWRLALTYRSAFAVPYRTDTTNVAADLPLAFDIVANAFYSPETWVLGAAYDRERFTFTCDLSWRRWSHWRPPFAELDASLVQPLAGALEVRTSFAPPPTRDVLRAAGSVEARVNDAWSWSSGYAFETRAFSPQPGPTNLIDGAKHIVGLGATWTFFSAGRVRSSLNAAVQSHYMEYMRHTKNPALLPDEDPDLAGQQTTNLGYPTIAGGGLALAATLSVAVEVAPKAAGGEMAP